MILSSYYNEKNECLIISSSGKVVSNKVNDDVVDFYDKDNNLVGRNVFKKLNFKSGYINLSQIKEYLEGFSEYSSPFLYGHIKDTKPHPKSEKLKICEVDLKSCSKQIVCGASNCEKGNMAIVAVVGAVMANGMTIKQSEVINVESFGMLCSLKELGHQTDEQGIYLQQLDNLKVGMEVIL